MATIRSERISKYLEELKEIAEVPTLYLENYFSELRNDVDKVIISKLTYQRNDEQKQTELNQIWKEMIAKINSFEQQCLNTEVDLTKSIERMNVIEAVLNDKKRPHIKPSIQDTVDAEEISLMKQLFQNQTIFFLNDQNSQSLLDGKLIIIKDGTIRKKAYLNARNRALNNEIVKIILVQNKMTSNTNENIKEVTVAHLLELDLSKKQLVEIKVNNTFNGLSNLRELNLSRNQLTEIKDNTFSDLMNLQHLDLSQNKIFEIKQNALNGLICLQHLDLSDNILAEIKANAFHDLFRLEKLYLGSNQFGTIKADSFNGLSNLQSLDLYQNKLVEIGRNAFAGLISLEELSLYSNKLVQLKEKTFSALKNMKKLHLNSNQLWQLDANAFNGLLSLEELNLSDNKLVEIKANALNGLSNLKTLCLGNNRLAAIQENAFNGLINLKTIRCARSLGRIYAKFVIFSL